MTTNVSKEVFGTFIDAIYAIAVTLLALEIPGEFEGGFLPGPFAEMLVEYALSFLILFALWVQHRRIIGLHATQLSGPVVWINCLILLLVCLVPRATTLVFNYGDNVTLAQLEMTLHHRAEISTAEIVDLFYVALVMAAEIGLLILIRSVAKIQTGEVIAGIYRSTITLTILTLVVLLLSFLLPVENRYVLILVPLILIFERKLSALIFR